MPASVTAALSLARWMAAEHPPRLCPAGPAERPRLNRLDLVAGALRSLQGSFAIGAERDPVSGPLPLTALQAPQGPGLFLALPFQVHLSLIGATCCSTIPLFLFSI